MLIFHIQNEDWIYSKFELSLNKRSLKNNCKQQSINGRQQCIFEIL